MAIDLDFSQVTLENYDNFTIQGYSLLMKELDGVKHKLNESSYSGLCLADTVSKLRRTKLPLYRYVCYCLSDGTSKFQDTPISQASIVYNSKWIIR